MLKKMSPVHTWRVEVDKLAYIPFFVWDLKRVTWLRLFPLTKSRGFFSAFWFHLNYCFTFLHNVRKKIQPACYNCKLIVNGKDWCKSIIMVTKNEIKVAKVENKNNISFTHIFPTFPSCFKAFQGESAAADIERWC